MPKAESFMKTLKVEAVYRAAHEMFEDVTADLPPASWTRSTKSDGCIPRSAISARCSSWNNTPGRQSKRPRESVHPRGAHSTHRRYHSTGLLIGSRAPSGVQPFFDQ